MATELGKAYVQIVPSAKGIQGSIGDVLEPEAGKAGKKAGKTLGGGIGTFAKVAIVAAGIGAVVGKAVTAGGELEQNLGGAEAVFGEFASGIKSTATEAYKNMGMSASDYMATANKMGTLFQGSGIEQQKALDLTSTAMQRAADVASVMGLDTSAAMESIAGAAKGNFTMMDNLGVAMNATSLEAYALEKGVNFEWKTATQAQKSELAMKMFMDKTTQYAGNFAKESSTTFAGSLGAMQSAFTNMLASLTTGQGLGPALEALGGSVVTFAQNLLPMIGNVLKELPNALINILATAGPGLIESGVTMIADLAKGLGDSLPTLIQMAVDTVLALVDGLIANIPMLVEAGIALNQGLAQGLIAAIPALILRLPEIINSLINGLLASIPLIIQAGIDLITALVTALPEIIAAIVAVLPVILDALITGILGNIPMIVNAGILLLSALVGALPEIIMAIVAALPTIIDSICSAVLDNLPLIVQAGVSLFVALVADLPAIIGTLIAAMPQIISGIVSALAAGIPQFVQMGKDLLMGLARGIGDSIGGVIQKAREAADKIVGSVKNFFGIRSPSRVFAGMGEQLDAGLAQGIAGNVRPITKAMDEVSALTARSFESEIAFSTTSPSNLRDMNASISSGLRTEFDIVGQQRSIEERTLGVLEKYLPILAEGKNIVMESGQLVGALRNEMNAQLGHYAKLQARGI